MREPFVGEVVAYHPGHDEGLGHAIRPALVTEFFQSTGRSSVTLSVFLTDGRVVPRVHPRHVLDSEPLAGYWDFLPAAS